jgi:KipI family sensor histidine kinase inhibitor
MRSEPRVLPLGDAAATVTFGDSINPEMHERALGLAARLALQPLPGVIEWAPAFASVTLWYDPDQITFDALRASLAPVLREGARKKIEGASFVIPFCRDADFAPDLAETAALKNLSPDQYIDRFAGVVFEVAMLGFQPGFAYLGGLPDALDAPRLATPRKHVPARSVAVADGMCAAYPLDSPGGWRLIGRTPAPLFDPRNPERPALLTPCDKLRWRPIDRATFERLERQWAENFSPDVLRESS